MFGWRKKRDGFEWRNYVRTTIVLRREQRRARLEELRQAAAERAVEAGKLGAEAGAAGVEAAKAGLDKAGSGARRAAGRAGSFLVRAGGIAGMALKSAGRRGLGDARAAFATAGRRLASAGREGLSGLQAAGLRQRALRLAPPQIALPCFVAGLAALMGAGFRLFTIGPDQTALAAGTIAVVLLTIAGLALIGTDRGTEAWLPTLLARRATAPEDMTAQGPRTRHPVWWPLAAGLGLAGIIVIMALSGVSVPIIPLPAESTATTTPAADATVSPQSPPSRDPASSERSTVRGFAVSLTGDSMRIGGTTVRLAGVAAPDPAQSCAVEGRSRWPCGLGALNALRKITGRATISCAIEGRDSRGRLVGACSVGGQDIGAQLIAKGHAFADGGLISNRYRREETAARDARLGVWRGPAQRPQEFRESAWDTARRARPDGCPIKGRASGKGKYYLLPWARGYDRTDIRESRGDRWFCTEAEALQAGWRPQDG
ncbi:MAG: thermonuclease family protein [Hyphomicrobiaceae bacterium]|nr:thermonuclease family protein [Hyphomicrobiaceae bacterium]